MLCYFYVKLFQNIFSQNVSCIYILHLFLSPFQLAYVLPTEIHPNSSQRYEYMFSGYHRSIFKKRYSTQPLTRWALSGGKSLWLSLSKYKPVSYGHS